MAMGEGAAAIPQDDRRQAEAKRAELACRQLFVPRIVICLGG